MTAATWCEPFGTGLLGQPANAITSLAFLVAAAGILLVHRRHPTYAALVAAVGIGSLIQHGPHPSWQAYAHDLPLAAVLAYVATDAASDLTGRRRSPAWWLVPTAAMVPIVAAGSAASTAAQAALAVAAIGLSVVRARERPALRRTLVTALVLLGAGALIGTLGDRTGLCLPGSVLQGHAVWHVLAAASLFCLAGAIGARGRSTPYDPERTS